MHYKSVDCVTLACCCDTVNRSDVDTVLTVTADEDSIDVGYVAAAGIT